MNYLDAEEKLITAQLNLQRYKKQEESLSKIDATINTLQNTLPERLPVTLKIEENLNADKKLQLPLIVRGDVLGVGRHKRRYYTADELRKSVEFYQRTKNSRKPIPIRFDHKKPGVSFIVGTIDDITWDESEQIVKYEGHINDETYARNVLDAVIGEVSGGMDAIEEFSVEFGPVAKDIEYTEISIVEKGSFAGNTITAVV